MFALVTAIQERLQSMPQLAGWDVRRYSDVGERNGTAMVDVSVGPSQVEDSEVRGVVVNPLYIVRLAHRISDDSPLLLDAAVKAVIEKLHNWYPRDVDGQHWKRMALDGFRGDDSPATGFDGCVLAFSCGTTFDGCEFNT